jgi:hypothetical protein
MAQNTTSTELVAGLFNVVNAEELGVSGIRRGRSGNSQYAAAIRTLAGLDAGQALQLTVYGNKARTNTRAAMIAANKSLQKDGEGVKLLTRTRETGNTNEAGDPEIQLFFIKGGDSEVAE